MFAASWAIDLLRPRSNAFAVEDDANEALDETIDDLMDD